MDLSTILMIIAFICFVLASVGVAFPRAHFGWIGLAFWSLALLIASGDVAVS